MKVNGRKRFVNHILTSRNKEKQNLQFSDFQAEKNIEILDRKSMKMYETNQETLLWSSGSVLERFYTKCIFHVLFFGNKLNAPNEV